MLFFIRKNKRLFFQNSNDNKGNDRYRVNAPTISKLKNDPAFAAEQAALYGDTPAAGMYTSPNTDVLGCGKIPERYRSQWSNETQAALAEYPADWPEVEHVAISFFLGNQVIEGTDPSDVFNYATLAIIGIIT
ncbi:hypothetical protein EYC80_000583 [Monilinia laxa]|uniref:Uncharacterized protein n=1 Tax=Monilinia laxa TaxID=61186 RepID=A0A5N6KB53_MONLA|nr:hypothetical protein EYC80_000583 [Monilinia laxa]